MLNLSYYFVDVGENYCNISQRSCIISLKDAIKNKDIENLKLAKEIIRRNFKKKYLHEHSQDYKMVYVNKADKLFIETTVDAASNPRVKVEPLFSCPTYDLYLMSPGQSLCVRCQVLENEVEIRNLSYDSIKSPKKKRQLRK